MVAKKGQKKNAENESMMAQNGQNKINEISKEN